MSTFDLTEGAYRKLRPEQMIFFCFFYYLQVLQTMYKKEKRKEKNIFQRMNILFNYISRDNGNRRRNEKSKTVWNTCCM